MKLTSLLLSSAAVLVAGSAFAADLPAKKAAPAAAVTACPAFGAGFWTVPGTDTCIQITGRVAFVPGYTLESTDAVTSAAQFDNNYSRVAFDVRSNSEIGVVRSFYRISTSSLVDAAYIQAAGFTFGNNSSLVDIAGSKGWMFDTYADGGSGIGITYSAALGSSTLSIGVMKSANNNSSNASDSAYVSDTPDVEASFSTTAGMATLTVAGVLHTAMDDNGTDDSTQGYAVLANLGVTSGVVSASIYGGMSRAALAYTGNPGDQTDYDGDDTSEGSVIGGGVSVALGQGSLDFSAEQVTQSFGAAEITSNLYGVMYAHTLAKGLTIAPELVAGDIDGVTSSAAYLRIQRDF